MLQNSQQLAFFPVRHAKKFNAAISSWSTSAVEDMSEMVSAELLAIQCVLFVLTT